MFSIHAWEAFSLDPWRLWYILRHAFFDVKARFHRLITTSQPEVSIPCFRRDLTDTEIIPAINENDHGPRVLLAGGTTLAATILMTAVALYNRFCAETLHHTDTPLLVVGVVCPAVPLASYNPT